MKKAIVITTLLGLGFMLIAATLFITLPLMLGQNAFYSVLSLDWTRIPEIIKGLFVFTDISVPHILVLASIAVGLLLFVVTIIVMIIKKKPSSLFPSLFLLVDIALYTADGRPVWRKSIAQPRQGEEAVISLRGTTPGAYLIRINTTAGTLTRKVLVK